MPIYDYKCAACGDIKERYAKVSQTALPCPSCGAETQRLLTTRYSVHADLEPYWDPHIGREPVYIKSKQHRREVMKREGTSEIVGKGWV
jgi:putative FmdB family regulatory protein